MEVGEEGDNVSLVLSVCCRPLSVQLEMFH